MRISMYGYFFKYILEAVHLTILVLCAAFKIL